MVAFHSGNSLRKRWNCFLLFRLCPGPYSCVARVEEAMHAKGTALVASLLLVALVEPGGAALLGQAGVALLPTAAGAGRAFSTAGGGLVKGRGVGG